MATRKRTPEEYEKALKDILPIANAASLTFDKNNGPLEWPKFVIYNAVKLIEAIDEEVERYAKDYKENSSTDR